MITPRRQPTAKFPIILAFSEKTKKPQGAHFGF